MKRDREALPTHLERVLGKLQAGLRLSTAAVDVARFSDTPYPTVQTLCTLGLRNHELHQAASGPVRLELMMLARAGEEVLVTALLDVMTREFLETRHAPTRGEVIGPRGPLFAGASVEALLALAPTLWPRALEELPTSKPSTSLIWLLPITKPEAELITNSGLESFTDLLERMKPACEDFRRSSLV